MTNQPEALRLADHLQEYWDHYDEEYKAAIELRRLHEVNQSLIEGNQLVLKALKMAVDALAKTGESNA